MASSKHSVMVCFFSIFNTCPASAGASAITAWVWRGSRQVVRSPSESWGVSQGHIGCNIRQARYPKGHERAGQLMAPTVGGYVFHKVTVSEPWLDDWGGPRARELGGGEEEGEGGLVGTGYQSRPPLSSARLGKPVASTGNMKRNASFLDNWLLKKTTPPRAPPPRAPPTCVSEEPTSSSDDEVPPCEKPAAKAPPPPVATKRAPPPPAESSSSSEEDEDVPLVPPPRPPKATVQRAPPKASPKKPATSKPSKSTSKRPLPPAHARKPKKKRRVAAPPRPTSPPTPPPAASGPPPPAAPEPPPPAPPEPTATESASTSAPAPPAEQPAPHQHRVDIEVEAEEPATRELFALYQPTNYKQGGTPHVSAVIETASLGYVQPKPLRGDEVPQALIDDGRLSILQLEALAYAAFRFAQPPTPSGERPALMLADGAGSGKGRMQAGIMTATTMTHPTFTRHVWISTSADLHVDADRDIRGVRATMHAGLRLQTTDGIDYDSNIPAHASPTVLFCTYAWLRSRDAAKGGGKKKRKKHTTRLDQLLAWMKGGDFEGCVCLDECHASKAYATGSKPSATGAAVHALLEAAPRARVVFASATFASSISELNVYASRLGIFSDFNVIKRKMQRMGVVALEVIAAELKRENALLSRSLSYEGVEFRTKSVVLEPHHVEAQVRAAALWARIFQLDFFANAAADDEEAQAGARAETIDRACAFAASLRFWRNFLLWTKVPSAFEEIQDAVRAGETPIIGLVTTDAAASTRVEKAKASSTSKPGKRRAADSDSDTDSDSDASDDDTATTSDASADGLGSLVDCVNGVLVRIEKCAKTAVPVDAALLSDVAAIRTDLVGADLESVAALDLLTDRCAAAGLVVAELSGRTHTFPLRADGSRLPVKKANNLTLQDDFKNDHAHVAIISQAASTGISLHADPKCANDRKRRHIVLQTAWSSQQTLQACGRSHRSGQRVPPTYVVLSTGHLETRFSAVVGARIRTMSGTRGDGEAKCGHSDMSFADEDLVGPTGTVAVKALHACLIKGGHPVTWSQPSAAASSDADTGCAPFEFTSAFAAAALDALHATGWRPELTKHDPFSPKRFLNRLLGVSMRDGLNERIFQLFAHLVDIAVFEAKRRGRYHRERAQSIVVDDTSTNITADETHRGVRLLTITKDTGITFEAARARHDALAARGARPRFVRSAAKGRAGFKKHYHALVFEHAIQHTRLLLRPSGRLAEMQASDVSTRYVTATDAAFEAGWREEHADTEQSRVSDVHVALLPVLGEWNLVVGHSAGDGMRTARVTMPSGDRLLGMLLPAYVAKSIANRAAIMDNEEQEKKVASTAGGAAWSSTPTWQSARDRLRAVLANGSAADDVAVRLASGSVVVVSSEGTAHVQGM